jgi:hypothetical protein
MTDHRKRHGRRRPYTEIGIRRLPCFRCGEPAHAAWQICADENLYRPLCLACDVELNEMVLVWVGDPDAARKIAAYKEAKLG